jgi:CubicO group peptidase (beta-lactamase class C family)
MWCRVLFFMAAALCGVGRTAHAATAVPACAAPYSFGFDEPNAQNVDTQKLLELTDWIRDKSVPVLSLTISRNGWIIYELYTSGAGRDDAHYVMSVTKSVTSALVGAAIDRGLLPGSNAAIAAILPQAIFPNAQAFGRFQAITLKHVLGMSALDAPVLPHSKTPDAVERSTKFNRSANRLIFALEQAPLAKPGIDFLYTDVTPYIAGGAVQYAGKDTLLGFGRAVLFDAMGFKNVDWMHQDPSGIDNPSFGLRLRPVDMQKFGLLYLNGGCWEGRQLLSRQWVSMSLTPWIKSKPQLSESNYGWYWWKDGFASRWNGHTANGWKGQRITVFRDKGVVVTMTGVIEDGSEGSVYTDLINRFVIPSLSRPRTSDVSPSLQPKLKAALADLLKRNTILPTTEQRMVPSIVPTGQRRPFRL